MNKIKKLLLLLLCVPLLFSCGENEKKVTIGSCEITEDLWISEKYNFKDTIGEHISSLYDAIKFLKNGEIKRYLCTQPFINKKSDTLCKNWGYEKSMDTCCYSFPIPNNIFKWKKIKDTIIVTIPFPLSIGGEPIILPDYPPIILIDCNRLKYGDAFYNRSPKLNNALYERNKWKLIR